MGDPLSVASAVVGLVVAGKEVVELLYFVSSGIKEAPDAATAAILEVNSIQMVIQQLQAYVFGTAYAALQRRNLITVEHITASLAGCVTTYSDFKTLLSSLRAETGMRPVDRALWLLKRDKVDTFTQRLQNHKSTFSLMLNILQCSSMAEAETSMDRLCDTVNEILRSNQELSLRLRNLEDATLARGAHPIASDGPEPTNNTSSQPDPSADPTTTNFDTITISSAGSDAPPRLSADNAVARTTHFEEILHRSHVYRHTSDNHSQSSLLSDARSTLALSICSSVTLGEVSNISVFAIPIYAVELSNARCYTFDTVSVASGESTATGRTVKSSASAATRRDLRNWWAQLRRTPKADRFLSKEPPPGVFGVPLTASIRYANVAISLINEEGKSFIYGYVPIILAKCGVFLKEKATDVEYIFETAGSPLQVQELQTIFDAPERYGKGVNWTGYTIHTAASLLMRFLFKLPEPIIPGAFYDRFREPLRSHQMEAVGKFPDQKAISGLFVRDLAIRQYQELITELPPLARQSLLYLLDLLAVFASKAEINKMTTPKLAALFQPGILAHPQHLLQLEELRLSQDILIFLIENQDNFLIGMAATAIERQQDGNSSKVLNNSASKSNGGTSSQSSRLRERSFG